MTTTLPQRPAPPDTPPPAHPRPPQGAADAPHLVPRRRALEPAVPAADDLRVLLLLVVADRAVGDHEPPEDEPDRLGVGGLRQLRRGAHRSRTRPRRDQHHLLRAARAAVRLPAAAVHGGADERGAPRQGALLGPRLPARSSSRRSSRCCCGSSSTAPTRTASSTPCSAGSASRRSRGSSRRCRRCRRSCSRRRGRRPAGRSSSTSPRCSRVPPELYDAAEVDGAASGARSGTSRCRSCAASSSSC